MILNQIGTRPWQRLSSYITAALFSVGVAALLFLWQGRLGFNLADEGFLWYGVQRVMHGEVPLRDFMSYDPGRYYWSAMLMQVIGSHGLLALRVTEALMQALTLFLAVCLIGEKERKVPWPLCLAAVAIFTAWMVPSYKQFDRSAAICVIGALALLLGRPDFRNHFLAGTIVGLVAFFGRNHGLYGLVGSIIAIAYLYVRGEYGRNYLKFWVSWMTGIFVGYLPLLLMLVLVPGFAGAFWDSIRLMLESRSTNLPLPLPWHFTFGGEPISRILAKLSLDFFFLAILLFGIGGIAYAFWQAKGRKSLPPIVAACAFLSLPFAHYAFSRSDVEHLAPSVFPFLIASLALVATRSATVQGAVAATLLAGSLLITVPWQPGYQHFKDHQWVKVNLGGDSFTVDPNTASILGMLNKLATQVAPNRGRLLAAPFWPGAYAALEQKSPIWENYALFPRSRAFQEREIERIKSAHLQFAVINNFPQDYRDQLRFSNTHPLIDEYLRSSWALLPSEGYTADPEIRIYAARER